MTNDTSVAKGYKQTEIGLLPDDWDIQFSTDVINYLGGYGFSSKLSSKDGVKWLKIANVGLNEIKWDADSYLPERLLNSYKRFTLSSGDVVMALTRPLLGDRLKVARLQQKDLPALLNQRVAKLVAKNGNSLDYIYYIVQRAEFIAQMNLAMAGTDPPNIGTKALANILIAVPKPKEQLTIANALLDVDALIVALEALVSKKSEIRRAAMQQLLTGRRRLAEFATHSEGGLKGKNKGLKQSDLGLIPEDWSCLPLGDFLSFKNGLNKDKEYFGYGTPIVNYMDVYGSGALQGSDIKGKVLVDSTEQKNYEAKKGDIFFTRTSETTDEIGLSSVLMDDIEGAVFSGFVLRARQKVSTLTNEFMRHCFRSEQVRHQIQSSASYTTRALTNGKSLSKVMIAFPSKAEQAAIANILSDMDDEIQNIEVRLSKTRQIKKGMMQELLTGKTRLPLKKD
ncbi:restriction endonuclease subunit S [Vibrio alginolyticus]|uniref:restriction endonuclease subunit S n=1 Tax=Vibrio alginolyticus TaxID=663 RepID=UPI00215CB6BB|nr:restriction endonuclease subunit S [Vibrio alginolyticus]ELA7326699.1 restriction endonuclease subunit S [Vibrio alginolyticus]MCR9372477.1 restriction endonuclease subunit S [Vibrio alginolyticus]MCR9407580.1 restriction endonuclease subunit S [Vibrio alginolyticus]